MGVGSAALATAISQFVSAILCMVHLMRVEEEYCLELREIRFGQHYVEADYSEWCAVWLSEFSHRDRECFCTVKY